MQQNLGTKLRINKELSVKGMEFGLVLTYHDIVDLTSGEEQDTEGPNRVEDWSSW